METHKPEEIFHAIIVRRFVVKDVGDHGLEEIAIRYQSWPFKMKMVVKEVKDLVTKGKVEDATKKLPEAYKAIDKAAKRGVIKKNTANRKKSLL